MMFVLKIQDPIELLKGDVYQNTGIEWESVSIMLSTGNPTVSNSQPNLKPWYLYYYSNQKRKVTRQRDW